MLEAIIVGVIVTLAVMVILPMLKREGRNIIKMNRQHTKAAVKEALIECGINCDKLD